MAGQDREKELAEMTAEELEQRLRETFFYPDVIDDTVFRELEAIREALEKKRPAPHPRTPQEAWAQFLEDHGEELAYLDAPKKEDLSRSGAETGNAVEGGGGGQTRGVPMHSASTGKRKGARLLPALLRRALIAAVIMALLAGAALAAGPKLWAWVSGWSAPLEPQSTGSPIQQALAARGITEPLYPSWLPSGYALTEAHISEDPLLLYELYTREDRYISITITPVTAVEKAQYSQEDPTLPEYRVGEAAHYIFSNGGYVTAVWYTEHYFVSINGNIYSRAMKRIVDSVYAEERRSEP